MAACLWSSLWRLWLLPSRTRGRAFETPRTVRTCLPSRLATSRLAESWRAADGVDYPHFTPKARSVGLVTFYEPPGKKSFRESLRHLLVSLFISGIKLGLAQLEWEVHR